MPDPVQPHCSSCQHDHHEVASAPVEESARAFNHSLFSRLLRSWRSRPLQPSQIWKLLSLSVRPLSPSPSGIGNSCSNSGERQPCPCCGVLPDDSRASESRRAELVKAMSAGGIAGTVVALSLATILSVLSLTFHALVPSRFHYLDPEQLQAIRVFLGAILVSGLLSDYARRLVNR